MYAYLQLTQSKISYNSESLSELFQTDGMMVADERFERRLKPSDSTPKRHIPLRNVLPSSLVSSKPVWFKHVTKKQQVPP